LLYGVECRVNCTEKAEACEKYVPGAVTLSLLHYYKLIVEMRVTALGTVVVSAVRIFWYLTRVFVRRKQTHF
jgi:hypothetical protein